MWGICRNLFRTQKFSERRFILVLQHIFYFVNGLILLTFVVLDIWNVQGDFATIFVFDAVFNEFTVLFNVHFSNYANSFAVTPSARKGVGLQRARIEVYQAFRDFQRLLQNLLRFFANGGCDFESAWLFLGFLLIFTAYQREIENLFQIHAFRLFNFQNLRLVLAPVVSRSLENLIFAWRDT